MVASGHTATDAGQLRRHFDDVRMDDQPSGVRAHASPRVELPSPNGRVPSSRVRATLPDIGYELADHRQPAGEAAGDEEKPLRLHAAYGRLRLMRRLSLSAATVATGGQTNGHPARSEALGCPRYGWDGCGQRYNLVTVHEVNKRSETSQASCTCTVRAHTALAVSARPHCER